jgi:hypothetical protein
MAKHQMQQGAAAIARQLGEILQKSSLSAEPGLASQTINEMLRLANSQVHHRRVFLTSKQILNTTIIVNHSRTIKQFASDELAT